MAIAARGERAVVVAVSSVSRCIYCGCTLEAQTAQGETRFDITGGEHRYYVIWITRLGQGYNTARINDVRAT